MFSLRLGHLAVLTVHRTVIHCRSAVRKTLCVFLTTSELFALRAHNPAPTWLQPTLQAKRKATRMGCFLFGCGDGIPTTWSCQILCGEFVCGHLAVLTVHRTVIHCRSAVRKTLCVLLTTSELFALRAHNPAPTWLKPTPHAKRKATPNGLLSFWKSTIKPIQLIVLYTRGAFLLKFFAFFKIVD